MENTIDFSSQARLGYPSDPVLMKAIPDDSVKGDVNGDGSINIQDIVVVVDFVAKGTYNATADMNGDGAVNIQDVVVLVNLSLK